MQKLIGIVLLGFFAAIPAFVDAQGCSDAGFCTAGALQPHTTQDTSMRSSIGLALTAGSGEQGVLIFTPQLEWRQQLARSWNIEIKLPYYIAEGNLGAHAGPGDPIVTSTKSWRSKAGWQLFATAGVRISLTDASARDGKGRPLPMPYQQGLGTTDFICGMSAQYGRWLFFSAGYQQPVVQYNNNGYLNTAMPVAEPEYNAYFDSRKLLRRGDILLRAEANYQRKRWTLSGGPLLIYHLGKDKITDASGTEKDVTGSNGLTLNLAAKLGYMAGRSTWELGGGTPFVVRAVRPDGLTREWVLTLRYALLLK